MTRDDGSELVLYDLEYTAWEGSLKRNWSEEWEHREIVEIGAIRVNRADWREIAAFNVLVRPRINREISAYLTDLTGLTNQEIELEGCDLGPALEQFREFLGTDPAYSFGPDHEVIEENIVLYDLPPALKIDGRDIRAGLLNLRPDLSDASSGDLAARLGLLGVQPAHRALNDVRSLRASLACLTGNGAGLELATD